MLAVYTAADLAAYGPRKCALDFKQRDGSAMKKPVRQSLAKDKVRFGGDPIACVVAETAVQAKERRRRSRSTSSRCIKNSRSEP